LRGGEAGQRDRRERHRQQKAKCLAQIIHFSTLEGLTGLGAKHQPSIRTDTTVNDCCSSMENSAQMCGPTAGIWPRSQALESDAGEFKCFAPLLYRTMPNKKVASRCINQADRVPDSVKYIPFNRLSQVLRANYHKSFGDL
jgi:hypothetical protein